MRFLPSAVLLVLLALPASAASPWVITNDNVNKECGACHMAFQPLFLPARSWQAIMSDLSNHFGEDASITDPAVLKDITDYLVANAGDANGRTNGWLRRIPPDQTPLRITELEGWVRSHSEEVGAAAFAKAGSKANCLFCHRGGFGDD
jgi:hypothetical protein